VNPASTRAFRPEDVGSISRFRTPFPSNRSLRDLFDALVACGDDFEFAGQMLHFLPEPGHGASVRYRAFFYELSYRVTQRQEEGRALVPAACELLGIPTPRDLITALLDVVALELDDDTRHVLVDELSCLRSAPQRALTSLLGVAVSLGRADAGQSWLPDLPEPIAEDVGSVAAIFDRVFERGHTAQDVLADVARTAIAALTPLIVQWDASATNSATQCTCCGGAAKAGGRRRALTSHQNVWSDISQIIRELEGLAEFHERDWLKATASTRNLRERTKLSSRSFAAALRIAERHGIIERSKKIGTCFEYRVSTSRFASFAASGHKET
jgi:hypothetical protein